MPASTVADAYAGIIVSAPSSYYPVVGSTLHGNATGVVLTEVPDNSIVFINNLLTDNLLHSVAARSAAMPSPSVTILNCNLYGNGTEDGYVAPGSPTYTVDPHYSTSPPSVPLDFEPICSGTWTNCASKLLTCPVNVGGTRLEDIPHVVPTADFGGTPRENCANADYGTSIGAWQVDPPYDLKVSARVRMVEALDPRVVDARIVMNLESIMGGSPPDLARAIECFLEWAAEVREVSETTAHE